MVIGVLGYGLLILEGIGLGLLLGPMWPDGISLMLVWYGLYFGVLSRDLAEVAGDRMVSHEHVHSTLIQHASSKHRLGLAAWGVLHSHVRLFDLLAWCMCLLLWHFVR